MLECRVPPVISNLELLRNKTPRGTISLDIENGRTAVKVRISSHFAPQKSHSKEQYSMDALFPNFEVETH